MARICKGPLVLQYSDQGNIIELLFKFYIIQIPYNHFQIILFPASQPCRRRPPFGQFHGSHLAAFVAKKGSKGAASAANFQQRSLFLKRIPVQQIFSDIRKMVKNRPAERK